MKKRVRNRYEIERGNKMKYMIEYKKVKIPAFVFLILFVIFEEIIFSSLVLNTIEGLVWKILFSIPIGTILYLLVGLGNEKFNKVISYILIFLISFIFAAQVVYYEVYGSIISIFSIMNGGQVFEFWETILDKIIEKWYIIALLFAPFILWIVLSIRKDIVLKKHNKFQYISKIGFIVIIHLISIIMINVTDDEEESYSTKNLYYNIHVPYLSASQMGICTTMRLDMQRLIFGFEEKNFDVEIQKFESEKVEIPEEEKTGYNVLEIDFDSLIANETDETIKSMHEYFSTVEPTKKNKYTGMFEGKNLVVFVAEAFSTMSIREDLTPTLFKLYNEGFQFDNFYTPSFPVSTADGEYVTDTSLIPKEGVWSMTRIKGKYMPFSYANVFEKLGYSSNAYHNHTYTYYDRDEYIQTMGYDSYLAKGNGLEKRMNCSLWPNSDYEMVNVTVGDYINNDKFVAYYMTVSQHLQYNKMGNMMAFRNWNAVKDLPYSEAAKAYLATAVEFDKAIAELIRQLEKAGKLEDTVIAISGDHYPYGLTLEEINEISTYERDDMFEKYHMPFLVWCSSMEEPVKVESLGSSLDVLPTLLNLFGVDYDSRLLMGTDILSDSDKLVIFSNRSFITEKGRYSPKIKKFIPNEGVEVEEDYRKQISSIINGKYTMSRLILEQDYYNLLREYI